MKRILTITVMICMSIALSLGAISNHKPKHKSPEQRVTSHIEHLTRELNLTDDQANTLKSMALENANKMKALKDKLKQKQLAFHTDREHLENLFLESSQDQKVVLVSQIETMTKDHHQSKQVLKGEIKSMKERMEGKIISVLNDEQTQKFQKMTIDRRVRRMEKNIIRRRMRNEPLELGGNQPD